MPNLVFWDACGQWHWGLRLSSLWGHKKLYWVGENAKLSVPGRKRAVALGASVELPMGPRSALLDG
eukprot:7024586-Pyramimonas_sp.AAC.1